MHDTTNDLSGRDDVVPWITISDALMGGLVLMGIVALATAGTLATTEARAKTDSAQLAALRTTHAQVVAERDELKSHLAAVTARLPANGEDPRTVVELLANVRKELESVLAQLVLAEAKAADEIQKNNLLTARLELANDKSLTTVTALQEALAKANMALDKARTENTRLSKLLAQTRADHERAELKLKMTEDELKLALEARKKAEDELKLAQKARDEALAQLKDEEAKLKTALVKLKRSEDELKLATAARKRAEDDLKDALKAREKLVTDLAAAVKERMKAEDDLKVMTAARDTLKKELAAALDDRAKVEDALKAALKARDAALAALDAMTRERDKLRDELEKRPDVSAVHRKLLGLDSDMKKVAIVLDCSLSMLETKAGREPDWNRSRGIMENWVTHLGMDECAIVTFGTAAASYPGPGQTIRLRKNGKDDPEERKKLVAKIQTLPKPSSENGRTNTLAGLERAYDIPGLTTIILFTDGEPDFDFPGMANFAGTAADPDRMAKKRMELVYELIDKHKDRKVVVHVVGLGDYGFPSQLAFLRKIADKTGGTFIGR